MRNKNQYAEKSETWYGLNKPDINESQSDLVVFGVPFDGSMSYRTGAAEAPDVLRRNTLSATPSTEKLDYFDQLKVFDGGDFRGTDRETIYGEVKDYVEKLVAGGKRFTMIGGDHSVTIPVLQGVDSAVDEQIGIIHIGAHLSLCDEKDGDRYSHRSTHARTLQLANVDGPDNLFFIGIRSIERQEFDKVNGEGYNIKTAKDCMEQGMEMIADECVNAMKRFNKVYLTINVDGLDPAFAAGTGTPQFCGLSPRIILDLLNYIFSQLNIIGFDIVEIAPCLDDSLASMFAGRKMLTEMWGLWAKDIGKLEELVK